ncbi:MAG TPA: PfkB family carbohydrate kinase [Gammaproteobacteria bacterium]|nr:PfkB family carbohydrate kinase [Gammaproteobacteria bacterium]
MSLGQVILKEAFSLEETETLVAEIKSQVGKGKRMAFVSGNFNIVHPGHLSLLNFAAECADFLVVGLNPDSSPGTLLPQHLRLEGIRAIGCVDAALLLPCPAEELIAALQPDIVVKGKEHEQHFNPEQMIVESYGGRLLFTSGEASLSSLDLLRREFQEVNFTTIKKPADFIKRHHLDMRKLAETVHRFADLKVLVLGDMIVDEYVTCTPLGMSQEDPTIVVMPIKRDIFLGGAGIVAAHASSLGAQVHYFTVVGDDETANFARETLANYQVEACLIKDKSRPTTLKQRFRAGGKTLLRVSHLRHHDIGKEYTRKLRNELTKTIKEADLVIFSDFNYGCLSPSLVDAAISLCNQYGIPMVADSQSSSQVGDISRFQGMLLITPTEHEARLAARDSGSGLSILAEELQKKAGAKHVFVTLGAEGLLIHSPDLTKNIHIDQLPALNTAPKDVAGGGDCLLTCAALALVAGANIWESAYLGSIAAACQVGRIGNLPLTAKEVLQELRVV